MLQATGRRSGPGQNNAEPASEPAGWLAGWVVIRCDHEDSGCAAGFYLLRRGSAYYILPVLSSTPNVKVHQGSVELQIQLWVVSVQKDCVTSARDTYPANPVWVESTVHGGWVSQRRSLSWEVLDLRQVPGGELTFLSGPTRDSLNQKKGKEDRPDTLKQLDRAVINSITLLGNPRGELSVCRSFNVPSLFIISDSCSNSLFFSPPMYSFSTYEHLCFFF